MAESPASSLSSLTTDLTDEYAYDEAPHSGLQNDSGIPRIRPSKRQRLDSSWGRRSPDLNAQDVDDADISSDTSGDVPASPSNMSQIQDEEAGQEQVTSCRWEGCTKGNLGDMDQLVKHIHDVHIGLRQKKYSCEWADCSRKGMPHASGYALRAHMRSHTREKPFYCLLPECDRSFTRSDALAKHMRTVHETEALRPSDPIPKSYSHPPNRNQRLKLILSARPSDQQLNGDDFEHEFGHADLDHLESLDSDGQAVNTNGANVEPPWPAKEQYRLLRRQIHWAEGETEELKAEVEALEKLRKEEWIEKELVFNNVLEAELHHHTRKRGGAPDKQKVDVLPSGYLPLSGPTPWYREDDDDEEL